MTYVVSERLDTDGPAPIVFTYELDSANERNGATMSCLGPDGPLTRTVPLTSATDDATKVWLIRQNCLRLR